MPNLLTSIAEFHLEVAELDKAVPLLKQATDIAEKTLGPDHPILGRALNVSGLIARTQGRFNDAISPFQRSEAIWRKTYGEGHYGAVWPAHNLAVVYRDQGKYSESLAIFDRLLPVAEKLLGSDDREFAQMLNNVSVIYQDLGDYARAQSMSQRSLEIAEKAIGRESPAVALNLNNLAAIYSDQGKYSQALPLLTRSAETMEKHYGNNHPSLAAVLDNLGYLYQNMGDDEQAVSFFYKSFAIKRRALDPNHPAVARSLQALGELYYSAGDNEKALNLLGQCLMVRTKAYGNYHPEAADTLQAAAEIYLDQREFKKALDALWIALDLRVKAYGTNHPKIASCLIDLATTHRHLGNEEASLKLYQGSLQILEQAFGLRHPTVIEVIEKIGFCQQALNRTDVAIDFYSEALKNRRDCLADQVVLLPGEMGMRRITNSFFREEVFHSLCALGTRSNLPNAKTLGAEQLAMDKALLEEVQVVQAALEADPRTSTRELRERIQALQVQLNRLPESKIDPAERDARRRELQMELGAREARLAGQNELAATIIQSRNLALADIARSLPPQSVLIDFVQYQRYDFAAKTNRWKEQRYAAYLTFPLARDSTNVVVERVDLGEAAPINEAVELVCKRMSAGQFAAKDLPPALQRLSDLVYAPLARHLTNVSHLIVCPDGQLNRLPFEMLPVGNRFLVEEKTISYVTSGREVVRLSNPLSRRDATLSPSDGERAGRGAAGKSLVMGNPDFDLDLRSSLRESAFTKATQPSTTNAQPASQSQLTLAATRALSRDYRGLKFKPLPDSGVEATNVAKLLGETATLRLGPEAREAELKAVVSPRVLHLATHGFFLSDQEFRARLHESPFESGRDAFHPRPKLPAGNMGTRPAATARQRGEWNASLPQDQWENPLVRCGIALAGANRFTNWFFGRAGTPLPAASSSATDGAHGVTRPTWDVEDGLLTGLEASLLNLRGTELVILSACQTGEGEVKIGEGVMSLRRAFRIAGAETVLASHWPVSDKATSRLMTEFMRRWRAGEPRAKAWREAQLSLLRSKDFSNPYFWSAFTLTGQWR